MNWAGPLIPIHSFFSQAEFNFKHRMNIFLAFPKRLLRQIGVSKLSKYSVPCYPSASSRKSNVYCQVSKSGLEQYHQPSQVQSQWVVQQSLGTVPRWKHVLCQKRSGVVKCQISCLRCKVYFSMSSMTQSCPPLYIFYSSEIKENHRSLQAIYLHFCSCPHQWFILRRHAPSLFPNAQRAAPDEEGAQQQ